MVRQANRKPGKSGFLPRNLLLVFVFTTSLYSFIHDEIRDWRSGESLAIRQFLIGWIS
jgi:hypothetical protein